MLSPTTQKKREKKNPLLFTVVVVVVQLSLWYENRKVKREREPDTVFSIVLLWEAGEKVLRVLLFCPADFFLIGYRKV